MTSPDEKSLRSRDANPANGADAGFSRRFIPDFIQPASYVVGEGNKVHGAAMGAAAHGAALAMVLYGAMSQAAGHIRMITAPA
jgi:hypothetical protein